MNNNNIDLKSILIVIPTLNEEWGLGPTIKEINHYLNGIQILVVDAQSTDSTIEIANSLGVEIIFQKISSFN